MDFYERHLIADTDLESFFVSAEFVKASKPDR